MEFWGLEVKPGQPIKCELEDLEEEKYLHISQVSLGEVKKDKVGENIPVFVHVNGQKLVLGTLSVDRCPQFSVDLVFEKDFELSHGSKTSSVCFLGYKSVPDDLSESDSEDEHQIGEKANGKPEVKEAGSKPTTLKASGGKDDTSASKAKAKIDEELKKEDKPKAHDEPEEDDSDDDDSEEDESAAAADEDMNDVEDESDDEDNEGSEDDDEATPTKAASGKKRPAESSSKTAVPEKKAKVVTPAGGHKTGGDGKKGGHTATPHPAKQAAKTQGNADKAKQQTPKSAGSVTCKSCSRSFNSENALQAHTKAKHGTN